jgi:hypothetical protein
MDISSYVAGNKLKIKVEEQRRLDFSNEARQKAEKIAKAEPIPLDFIQFEFAQESMQERIARDGVKI